MDPERLANLYVEMGEARANSAVSRAMQELSDLLEKLKCDVAFRAEAPELQASSKQIQQIAEPLGLISLASAANNAANAAMTRDIVAICATQARLERVACRTLKMVWDLHDLSG